MHFLCKSLITSGLFFYKTLSYTILFSSTQHKSCTFASRSAMDEHRIWRDIAATWLVVWDGSEEKGGDALHLVTFGGIKKPMSVTKLGTILSTAGYKAVRKRIANIQTRGWIVYQRDSDEINSLKKILKD